VLQWWRGGMDAVVLNDNAVTDAADMLQRQLTLAGGDVEELEEVAAEDAAQSDWAELPDELVEKVLEMMEAAGKSGPQQGGMSFSQASATVRLVCAAWKVVHDALVKRLVLRPATTDEVMGMLVRRFPAVTSLEMKRYYESAALTDEGLLAVSGLRGLTSLNLYGCVKVTDAGLRAVSNLPALTFLDLRYCDMVTAAGVQALRNTTASPSLHIEWYPPSEDEEDAEDWEDWE
jgi:hypothetical protein